MDLLLLLLQNGLHDLLVSALLERDLTLVLGLLVALLLDALPKLFLEIVDLPLVVLLVDVDLALIALVLEHLRGLQRVILRRLLHHILGLVGVVAL